MNLNQYELAAYLASINDENTMLDVATKLYPENVSSVRTQISRKKVIDNLLDKNLLIAKRDGKWLFTSNKEKLREVLKSQDLPTCIIESKSDETNWIERIVDYEDKPAFNQFDVFFRQQIIIDYLENEENLGDKNMELVRQLTL